MSWTNKIFLIAISPRTMFTCMFTCFLRAMKVYKYINLTQRESATAPPHFPPRLLYTNEVSETD